jgi:predicted ferric reductase
MVAAVLLILSLLWGVLLTTRALKPMDRPAWMLAMHRWISGLAVTSTVVHLLALVADSYLYYGWKEILVPYGSDYKPGATALGIVAFYLLVLVQVTSLLMKKLPKRLWRGIHYSSYATAWLVMVHGATAGTDASNPIYQVVALILIIAAVTAGILRVIMGRNADQLKNKRAAADASIE